MRLFYLTRKALEDMCSIGRYTEKEWGKAQRTVYLKQLDAGFRYVVAFPDAGSCCEEIKSGYRKYRVGEHLIFYRQVADEIEITRILHIRMDSESHLG